MADRTYPIPPPFDEGVVEQQVAAKLKATFPWYLERFDAAARERGVLATGKSTLLPSSWNVSSEEARWSEQRAPAAIVVCPGSMDLMTHGAQASLAAWLQVNVVITAGGATEEGVRAISHRYAGAAREILAHQVVGDLVDQVRLLDWRYDLMVKNRTLLACGVRAAVRVDRILDMYGDVPFELPPPGEPATYETPVGVRGDVRYSPLPENA